MKGSSAETSERIVHENILIGISLSLLGGFLDAYTYTLKGGVFANAQTGNVVLLSISVFSGDWNKTMTYLIPILMFALGILLSEFLKRNTPLNRRNKRIKLVLLTESIIIVFVGITGQHVSHGIINSTISFLAAVQVANFNRINGSAVATTMITGNLRSTMEHVCSYMKTKDKVYIGRIVTYLSVILSFGVGAIIGAFFSRLLHDAGIFFCLILLFISYNIIIWEEKKSRERGE